MSLHTLKLLSASGRESSNSHSLIYLDIVTDNSGLTDHDTCSVVNKEILANGGTRMDVNTGLAVCVLCHHTWDERYSKQMQLMGYTVCSDCKQSRIAKDNLIVIVGCRVSVKKRSHISLHQSPDFWNPFKEIIADFLRHIDKLVMR